MRKYRTSSLHCQDLGARPRVIRDARIGIVGFRELGLAAWRFERARSIWCYDPLGRELKKRVLVLTVTGQRTHLTLSAYILKPCFAAGLFLSWLRHSPPQVRHPLGHDITGNISDVVVPRSELS